MSREKTVTVAHQDDRVAQAGFDQIGHRLALGKPPGGAKIQAQDAGILGVEGRVLGQQAIAGGQPGDVQPGAFLGPGQAFIGREDPGRLACGDDGIKLFIGVAQGDVHAHHLGADAFNEDILPGAGGGGRLHLHLGGCNHTRFDLLAPHPQAVARVDQGSARIHPEAGVCQKSRSIHPVSRFRVNICSPLLPMIGRLYWPQSHVHPVGAQPVIADQPGQIAQEERFIQPQVRLQAGNIIFGARGS